MSLVDPVNSGEEAQQALVARVNGLLRDLHSDLGELERCLDLLNATGWRKFGYDYYYLNFLSIFSGQCTAEEIGGYSAACARHKLFGGQYYCNYIARLAGDPAIELRPRLAGWQFDSLNQLLSRRRGALIFTGHYGPFRYLASDLTMSGYRVSVALDHQSAEQLRSLLDYFEKTRAAVGSPLPAIEGWTAFGSGAARVIDVEDNKMAPLEIIKALKRNEIVLFFADGNSGFDGQWGSKNRCVVPFLGYEVSVKSGLAQLAASVGSPLLPVITAACEGVDTVMFQSAVIPEAPVAPESRAEFASHAMRQFYSRLEEAIRKDPRQWDSASMLHRWRAAAHSAPSEPVMVSEKDEEALSTSLCQGSRFRLRSDRAVRVPTSSGVVLVDAVTLKIYPLTREMESAFKPLWEGGGLDQNFLQNWPSAEDRANILRALSWFERTGMLATM